MKLQESHDRQIARILLRRMVRLLDANLVPFKMSWEGTLYNMLRSAWKPDILEFNEEESWVARDLYRQGRQPYNDNALFWTIVEESRKMFNEHLKGLKQLAKEPLQGKKKKTIAFRKLLKDALAVKIPNTTILATTTGFPKKIPTNFFFLKKRPHGIPAWSPGSAKMALIVLPYKLTKRPKD